MSYALSAYLMSERDARVFGCKDFGLCDEVVDVMSERFDECDEMLDFDDETPISHRDALREIFAGTITRPEYAGVYGWAYEIYCSSMGERLNANPFSPCHYEWYERLDEFSSSHNIPLSFRDLIHERPIAIPESDDWPCVGHWPRATIVAARRPLKSLRSSSDPDIADALRIVLEWIELAVGRPHSMIVGFHG